jgi:hypothetical protein
MLHTQFGPIRSYPYSWRLPDLARDEGRHARLRARLALGLTLYAMGRFGEALANLPEPEIPPEADEAEWVADLLDLRARCLWLQDQPASALSLAEAAWSIEPRALRRLQARVSFLYLADDPEAALAMGADYREAARAVDSKTDQAWAALFLHWAHARLGRDDEDDDDPAPAHAALAMLRSIVPADAAQGEALFAEAVFHEAPAWSLAWLDGALVLGERFGLHHLKARLLAMKVCALEANGLLGESSRFLKLARETAQRQGAWRYLRDMAG